MRLLLLPLLLPLSHALHSYTASSPVPVECLNRTIETGEHVEDKLTGKLQYLPFFTCNETNLPLTLSFNTEDDISCTIPDVSDELYHMMELYIHNDAPMSCRVPARPKGGQGDLLDKDQEWVPLTVALAGKLELSHLHIAGLMNMVLHTGGEGADAAGTITAATAYSVFPSSEATRIVIGDPLKLEFRVRWYAGMDLPRSGTAAGGGAGRTILWCFVSAMVGAGVCYAVTVGVDLPRRVKRVTVAMRGRAGDGGIIDGRFERKGYGGYGFPGGGNGAVSGYGLGGAKRVD